MGFGPFGGDKNQTQQNLFNTQTTSNSGAAVGATIAAGPKSNSFGAGAQGNIQGGINVSGNKGKKSGSFSSVINISSPDAAAIDLAEHSVAYNASLSHDALEANQALSALAISYANQNATNAFAALQTLGSNAQVIQAGGSGADVAANNQALTGTTPQVTSFLGTTKGQLVVGIIVAVVSGYILFRITKRK